MAFFEEQPLPSRAQKLTLEKELGLSFRVIHVWFQNRRYVCVGVWMRVDACVCVRVRVRAYACGCVCVCVERGMGISLHVYVANVHVLMLSYAPAHTPMFPCAYVLYGRGCGWVYARMRVWHE